MTSVIVDCIFVIHFCYICTNSYSRKSMRSNRSFYLLYQASIRRIRRSNAKKRELRIIRSTRPRDKHRRPRFNAIDNFYFRFLSVWLNRLKNKLLANYLRNRGNDLATVRISAFCVAMLSNNSLMCKDTNFLKNRKCVWMFFLFI